MSFELYKILHIASVLFVFAALGGLILRALDGGDLGKTRARRLAGMTHGLALVVVLISGFGMLARLGIDHDWLFPPWVWGKLLIWLAIGASVAFVRRRPEWHRLLWWALPLLGAAAAYLAIVKPG